jgi:hypothetical protein
MKGHVWLWFGTAISAFALIGGLQTFIELARWADAVVRYWSSVTTQLWSYPPALLGIKFDPAIVPHLNFLFGLIAIGFSAMTLETGTVKQPRPRPTIASALERFARSMSIAMLALLIYISLQDFLFFAYSPLRMWTDLALAPKVAIGLAVITVGFMLTSQGVVIAFHALLLAVFVAAFYLMLTASLTLDQIAKGQAAADEYRQFILRFTFGFLPTQVVTALNFASPQYLNYRFVFVLLTTATILALSYLSRVLSYLAPA